jgi:hypothetical protein
LAAGVEERKSGRWDNRRRADLGFAATITEERKFLIFLFQACRSGSSYGALVASINKDRGCSWK